LPAGRHSAVWDGTDSAGRQVATGVYHYQLQAADLSLSRRMVLVK
jgi:flagellar hook assembly protein FlgD